MRKEYDIVQLALENDLILLHNDRDYEHMAKVITRLKLFEQKYDTHQP